MSLAYKRQGEGERDRQRGDELEKVCGSNLILEKTIAQTCLYYRML